MQGAWSSESSMPAPQCSPARPRDGLAGSSRPRLAPAPCCEPAAVTHGKLLTRVRAGAMEPSRPGGARRGSARTQGLGLCCQRLHRTQLRQPRFGHGGVSLALASAAHRPASALRPAPQLWSGAPAIWGGPGVQARGRWWRLLCKLAHLRGATTRGPACCRAWVRDTLHRRDPTLAGWMWRCALGAKSLFLPKCKGLRAARGKARVPPRALRPGRRMRQAAGRTVREPSQAAR